MPANIALRLSAAGQVFISKNRKISHPWRWGSAMVSVLFLATAGVLFTCLFLAWADLQYITANYKISQSQETQKELLDLNRKLRLELANLTTISRLERLAAEYNMGAPQPQQVVKLP